MKNLVKHEKLSEEDSNLIQNDKNNKKASVAGKKVLPWR